VDGAALNKYVSSFKVHDDTIIKLHLDRARYHHSIVNRVGPMIARGDTGLVSHNTKNSAAFDSGLEWSFCWILKAVIVDRKALRGPYHRR
jgi:hypothetical protein